MKKALISPNEPIQSGFRVAQIETTENIFQSADLYFGLTVKIIFSADEFWYDSQDKSFKEVPKTNTQMISNGSQPSSNGSQNF
jgi:steroid 5-alpha reductase family enzyme